MLALDAVHAFIGPIHVLQGVTLAVGTAQTVALLGRNGVGKTTTLRTIMGLVRAERGRIRFRGAEIGTLATHRIAALGIGFVPQGRKIFPSLTVLENLQVAARHTHGRPQWTIERIFALFPNLRERQAHSGQKLSGGEQQMLAIGRALIGNPALLLLDEPTEGLSPLFVQELAHVIAVLKGEGCAILLVEQDAAFARKCADVTYLMNKGRIMHSTAAAAPSSAPGASGATTASAVPPRAIQQKSK